MQRIELRTAIVLGVRTGDDYVVVFKAGETVIGDVLVGDHVVLVSHFFPPINPVKRGRVWPRRLRKKRIVLGTDARDGPQPGGQAQAATVGVGVIDRAAVFAV